MHSYFASQVGCCHITVLADKTVLTNLTDVIAEKISAIRTVDYLEELAKKGSREAYDAVLAKVPDVEPDE